MSEEIIHILKDANGYVSGEALSRTLGMTRAAVWKRIEELRSSGYEIEAAPRRGYCLVAVPDILSAAEIQHGLKTHTFGCQVHHFEAIGSTMTEAFRLGMEGAPEGAVVVAETQTMGRGRMGRVWSSPKGRGLYFSVILRPDCVPADAARLTLLAAVAVSEAVEVVSGVRALIKWPNDLLIGAKKVCGILTELNAELDRVRFVVVGIGLNVNTPLSQLPPEGTSLKVASGKAASRVALAREILRSFEPRYRAALKDGYAVTLEEWRKRSATIGHEVRYIERNLEVRGMAVGLADDGGLLVRLPDGGVVKRMAGDILL